MSRPHFIDEHEGAGRLVCRNYLSKDCLDFVFAAAKRNDDIGMVVNVKVNDLSRFEPNFPHADILVLKQEFVADFVQGDPAIRRSLKPEFVIHRIGPISLE